MIFFRAGPNSRSSIPSILSNPLIQASQTVNGPSLI